MRKPLERGAIVKTRKGYFCVTQRTFTDELEITGYNFTRLDTSIEQYLTVDELEEAIKAGRLLL